MCLEKEAKTVLCSRRVVLNLGERNIVDGCQCQSSAALRLLKGVLSIPWWYVEIRHLLERDVLVKFRFGGHSRSLEVKCSSMRHARNLDALAVLLCLKHQHFRKESNGRRAEASVSITCYYC